MLSYNHNMRQFSKKRRIRCLVYSKLTIAFLLILLFFITKGTWGMYERSKQSVTREDSAAVNLAKLESRKEKLQEDLDKIESRVGIEEQLRIRYSLSKEGERVIVIIDEDEVVEEITEEKKGFINSFFRKLNLIE